MGLRELGAVQDERGLRKAQGKEGNDEGLPSFHGGKKCGPYLQYRTTPKGGGGGTKKG